MNGDKRTMDTKHDVRSLEGTLHEMTMVVIITFCCKDH